MNSKQNLIVTGSSGRIGRLIQNLSTAGNYADFSTCFTDRQSADPALRWNVTGAQAPDMAKGGILLHLAGVIPGRGAAAELAENLSMAQAVLQADRAAAFAHVIFMSTVAVYAPQDSAISETTPPAPQSDYGKTKLLAEEALAAGFGDRLTILRLANLAGADALLGGVGPAVLDPVPGQGGGPLRSYIGPKTLVSTLGALLGRIGAGEKLPAILNLAQPGLIAMADLLDISGRDWRFGPERNGVIAKVEVDLSRLLALCPVPEATPAGLVAEVSDLKGVWP